MGINLGLDIGAISLKLAALGKTGDRPILAALCDSHPQFRLRELAGQPLVLSDYRRIAGSPIQSTYDLLREFYEIVPETHNATKLRNLEHPQHFGLPLPGHQTEAIQRGDRAQGPQEPAGDQPADRE